MPHLNASSLDDSNFQEMTRKRRRLNSLSSDSDQSEDYVKGDYCICLHLEINVINLFRMDVFLIHCHLKSFHSNFPDLRLCLFVFNLF